MIVTFLYSLWSATEIFVYTFMNMLKMDARSAYDLGELLSKMFMIFFAFLLMTLTKKSCRNDVSFRYNLLLMLVPAEALLSSATNIS